MPRDESARSGGIRHDLLANVHTLAGALELLATTRLTARQRRYADVCRRALANLTALCGELAGEARGDDRPPAIDELATLGVVYVPKPVTRSRLTSELRRLIAHRRPRVLVAEDSPDSAMLIRQFLADGGDVEVVHDGQAAVERFRSGSFDIAIIDLEMPVMDGCSAIRAIREWESAAGRAHIPVIVLTAHDLIRPIGPAGNAAAEPDADGIGDEIVVQPDPEIAHLVPGFLAARREDVSALLRALADSNYEEIRMLGHQLKGAGGGYGFDVVSALGHRLEEGAMRQDFCQVRDAVGDLADYLQRVRVEITPAAGPPAPDLARARY